MRRVERVRMKLGIAVVAMILFLIMFVATFAIGAYTLEEADRVLCAKLLPIESGLAFVSVCFANVYVDKIEEEKGSSLV